MSWEEILKEENWPKKVAFYIDNTFVGDSLSKELTLYVEHQGNGNYKPYKVMEGRHRIDIPKEKIPDNIFNDIIELDYVFVTNEMAVDIIEW